MNKKMIPNLDHLKKRIYYAQNREDLILAAFFHGEKNGFYVDVGAYDPDYDSVTKLFYDQGWNGINIEPQRERFALFEKSRTRDINLNIGIAQDAGELTLRSYSNQGLSTFSTDMKQRYETAEGTAETETFTDVVVPVLPLRDVCTAHGVQHIQFAKIDVEGFENEVIQSNDWKKFRPEVVCIEANHSDNAWGHFLRDNDYEGVFFDGLNQYYVDKKTKRKAHFDYVTHVVLERGGGLKIEDFAALKQANDEIARLSHIVNRADIELAKKDEQVKQLVEEVTELRGVRGASKHLKSEVKKKLRRSEGGES